jgi:hypothetical protein
MTDTCKWITKTVENTVLVVKTREVILSANDKKHVPACRRYASLAVKRLAINKGTECEAKMIMDCLKSKVMSLESNTTNNEFRKINDLTPRVHINRAMGDKLT